MIAVTHDVSTASTGTHTVLAVDPGFSSTRDADHLLQLLATHFGLESDAFGCTHFELSGPRRVVVTIDVPSDVPERDEFAIVDIALAVLADELPLVKPRPVVGVVAGDVSFGPDEQTVAASKAAMTHQRRDSGRVILFPGCADMVGVVSASELLSRSAIDALNAIGAGPISDADLIDTRGFVRPHWNDGVLTLDLMPAVGGVLVPFEVPNPTPCCADHGT
jgi:hypothetical protein